MAKARTRPKEIVFPIEEGVRLRRCRTRRGGELERLEIALAYQWQEHDWRRIVCFDNHGGVVHQDRYNPDGRAYHKHQEMFDTADLSQAVDWIMTHLLENYSRYVADFSARGQCNWYNPSASLCQQRIDQQQKEAAVVGPAPSRFGPPNGDVQQRNVWWIMFVNGILARHEVLEAEVPDGSTVFVLPSNDHELREHNLNLAKNHQGPAFFFEVKVQDDQVSAWPLEGKTPGTYALTQRTDRGAGT